MRISIVIPTLNEAERIVATLTPLQALRAQGHEVIVVDGGSNDATLIQAMPLCDHILSSIPGRARQMNAGVQQAKSEILWFLHADTLTEPADAAALLTALASDQHDWGRFDVRLSGTQPLLRVVEWLMNLRSRWTGIATGDQGIFVRRQVFDQVGGFPDIPLMEDIALSRLLKQHSTPACLRKRLITSSRRWEQRGVLRTIMLMWRLRFAYWRGEHPERLAALYRQG